MSKEARKLALEALEEQVRMANGWQSPAEAKAIAALREALANEALDKMAENARELGLDYEVEPKIGCVNHDCDKCKALAEPPAQEPVAWMEMVVANLVREGVNKHKARELAQHFYTSPPAQRTWVGLTLEDMETTHWSPDFRAGAKWADHKLKDKNNA